MAHFGTRNQSCEIVWLLLYYQNKFFLRTKAGAPPLWLLLRKWQKEQFPIFCSTFLCLLRYLKMTIINSAWKKSQMKNTFTFLWSVFFLPDFCCCMQCVWHCEIGRGCTHKYFDSKKSPIILQQHWLQMIPPCVNENYMHNKNAAAAVFWLILLYISSSPPFLMRPT